MPEESRIDDQARAGGTADEGEAQKLIGISFPDPLMAQEFFTASLRLASQGHLGLRDAVFVHKDESGNTRVRETTDPQPGQAALSGALWAGLFGLLLGGPVGWLAGTAVGAGGGAIAAKVVDTGISDEWVDWFRQAVQPGRVVLAILADKVHEPVLAREIARFPEAQMVYTNLSPGWSSLFPSETGDTDGAGEDEAPPPAT